MQPPPENWMQKLVYRWPAGHWPASAGPEQLSEPLQLFLLTQT
jgi:hypothetical protein